MPHYIVHIELHGAHSNNYDALNTLMREEGFSHQTEKGNILYDLPMGMYERIIGKEPNRLLENITEKVKPLAARTLSTHSVMVFLKPDTFFDGLEVHL